MCIKYHSHTIPKKRVGLHVLTRIRSHKHSGKAMFTDIQPTISSVHNACVCGIVSAPAPFLLLCGGGERVWGIGLTACGARNFKRLH